MWTNLYFGLKYAHLGCNLVWTFLYFTEHQKCGQFLILLIACIHGILSIIGMIMFLILKFLRKTSVTAKGWKVLMGSSIVLMLVCYLLCILELILPDKCEDASYFINSYKFYGLVELISPILLLIFLQTEAGDPREFILKKK